MTLSPVEVIVSSRQDFWETWLDIVKGSFALKALTPKEREILYSAIYSSYKYPFNGNAVNTMAKLAKIPKSKFIVYRKNLKEKGWLDDDFNLIPQIDKFREFINNEKVTMMNLQFVFKLKYDKSVTDSSDE